MTADAIVSSSLERHNDIFYSSDDKMRELVTYTSIHEKLRK